jgi:hypothetical protein
MGVGAAPPARGSAHTSISAGETADRVPGAPRSDAEPSVRELWWEAAPNTRTKLGPPKKHPRTLVAETVEHAFLRALKQCARRVIVFPILGHLSTRPGHASGFQRENQQNFDLPGC